MVLLFVPVLLSSGFFFVGRGRRDSSHRLWWLCSSLRIELEGGRREWDVTAPVRASLSQVQLPSASPIFTCLHFSKANFVFPEGVLKSKDAAFHSLIAGCVLQHLRMLSEVVIEWFCHTLGAAQGLTRNLASIFS